MLGSKVAQSALSRRLRSPIISRQLKFSTDVEYKPIRSVLAANRGKVIFERESTEV